MPKDIRPGSDRERKVEERLLGYARPGSRGNREPIGCDVAAIRPRSPVGVASDALSVL